MKNQNNINIVFLGLGSNIGNKLQYLKIAIKKIADLDNTNIISKSPVYKTPPIGFQNQDSFFNAVIKIETNLSPINLLKEIQFIENDLGRKRLIKWGPRTIDIDILFYGNKIIKDKNLEIPHPFLHERAFVLIPFNDIQKNFVHPVFKRTINDLLKDLQLKFIQDIELISYLD